MRATASKQRDLCAVNTEDLLLGWENSLAPWYNIMNYSRHMLFTARRMCHVPWLLHYYCVLLCDTDTRVAFAGRVKTAKH